MERQELITSAAATIAAVGLAGCSGSDDTDGGGNGGGSDDEGGGENDDGSGGAANPQAAVETYIEAGQEDDSEAMAAIVHPDGSATTSPDSDGGSMGNIRALSKSVTEESDTQASVTVEFEMTYSQDVEQQTTTFETVYEVRTYEGSWYVYSISGGL